MAEQTEEKLIEALSKWVADYKNVAERNALAETPRESADYLLSLVKQAGYLSSEEIEELQAELTEKFATKLEERIAHAREGYKSPEEVAELLAHARDGYIELSPRQMLEMGVEE